jgi:predicted acylesterase/phospholipase RssA
LFDRRRFLSGLGASAIAPALVAASGGEGSPEPLERALVLSGGGARGAYEAGVVGALAARYGASDGSPLPSYELVCGTSIGAVNGWFVATGQYTKLRELWYGSSKEHIIRAKPRYAALRDSQSGVLDRAISAVSLIALMRNERGLLQSEPVYNWIAENIDPSDSLLVPLAWAVTNLVEQRPEYFYLLPEKSGEELPHRVVTALQITLGPHVVVREATHEILHRAIFASAALPIVFDPVLMPGPDGEVTAYCDGGVASNSPVGIAHAIAAAADVILLDPPLEAKTNYQDAVEIAFGAYATMQRKILEVEMRNAYFQSVGKRALERLAPRERARATQGSEPLAGFMHAVPATELRYIRPDSVLPVGVVGFNDQIGIGKTYRLGWLDIARDFTPYDWRTFQL